MLRKKGERFRGILNGGDYDEWNPATDKNLAANYSAKCPEGKSLCKRDLLNAIGLTPHPGAPLVGMVSRMTSQKGLRPAPRRHRRDHGNGSATVMLANGDAALEDFFRGVERRSPEKFRILATFDNVLAHKIQAGSDAFLMPSRFEPCGLTQMYALKYGNPPVSSRDRRTARYR